MTIRPAIPADSERVAGLCTQLGYPSSQEEVKGRILAIASREDTTLLVAEDDGVVAGWIQATVRSTVESGTSVEVTGLVVDQSERGKGIGKSLMREIEQRARRDGHDSVVVRTNVIRVDTHRFYASLGYVETKKQTVFRKRI